MRTARAIRQWNVADRNHALVKSLATELQIPPLLAHLLTLRGVATAEAAAAFLRPTLRHLLDPLSLTAMADAVARITAARDQGDRILVFGDYDVDGISATAVLVNGLKRFGIQDLEYAVPHRLQEGYGLTIEHVDVAHRNGVRLIITVDNGISAHEAADRAAELGIDLIVTDHHAIERGLPQALAVINPKREPPDHPGAHLCGAGVALKLATALNGKPHDLDIAALGTIADVVPLLGANRVIVALGLRHMATHQRIGIAQLAAASGVAIDGITSEHIGFQLGPRLNAAGRLDDGATALDLLLADCTKEASRLARGLNEANQQRREIEQAIFTEACEELDLILTEEQRGIVLARHDWHVGVVGIVAARLLSRYHLPVVLITLDGDGMGRASARSGGGFDLIAALRACSEHLVQFGGHRCAAGLTIEASKIEGFRAAFLSEARRQLGSGEIVNDIAVDTVASFSEIDGALVQALGMLEPFGQENPAPVFCSMGVELVPHSVRILKEKHLKCSLKQGDHVHQAIGFGMAEQYLSENLGSQVEVVYTPKLNTWRGQTEVQLTLHDIRSAE